MKVGRTLSEVAAEIERQAATKHDYIADTRHLSLADDGYTLQFVGPQGAFATRDLALTQIGAHAGIPVPYMRRMQSEAPELLARNVNHWFQAKPAQRMVRTLDGGARAFLSSRFSRIDNLEVAETVLPILSQVADKHGGMEVVSTEVTEHRLYLKAVFPQLRREISSRRIGDIVEAGVLISNSEVGLGAVSVKAFARFLACLNGMTRDGGGSWRHVGRRADESEEIYALLTDEAKAADDRALLLKVRDTVAATLDLTRFDEWTAKIQGTTQQQIEGDVPAAVEILAKTLSLRQDEKSSVLRHLIEGGDLSRFGLMNAVTRTAEDVESYDRASEIEALGGAVVDLHARDWQQIATARPLAA
jgi:hypothetical protein